MNKISMALYLSILVSMNVFSQETVPRLAEEDLVGRLELAVPDNPAFISLGVTPEKVTKPGSTKELALTILRGVDGNGNLQSGIAVEAAPYILAEGKNIDLKDYQSNYVTRLLYSLQVSFATAAGDSSSDKADRTAIGLRFTPWNKGDMRNYDKLFQCYESIKKPTPPPDTNTPVNPGKIDTPERHNIAAEQCIIDAEKVLWNASSWDIGASVYDVEDSKINETGYSIWTSVALKIGRNGQFIGHARYNQNSLNPDVNGDDIMDLQDGYILGSRLRWGNPKSAFIIEGSYTDIEFDSIGIKDKYYDVMVGGEIFLMEGIWLHLGYGTRSGSDLPENSEDYLSGQVRWSISANSLRK
ncbi:hypothetical protein D0814_25175 [Vibrio parahaemolyticus]|nr:hypothetical protein [Vibrio parahaemolyticus]